jgi:hypothetical protein
MQAVSWVVTESWLHVLTCLVFDSKTKRAAGGGGGGEGLLTWCGQSVQQSGLLSCAVCNHLKLRPNIDLQSADRAATLSAAAVQCPAQECDSQALSRNPFVGCCAPVRDIGITLCTRRVASC